MHVVKPAFEHFRQSLVNDGRPLRERDVVPIEQAIVATLDTFPDLLVEKVRRQPHAEAMLDISAKWLGLDSNPDEVVRTLRDGWREEDLATIECRFHVLATDTAVVLAFAGAYPDMRYLSGRVRVTF